jgi:DNA-directed RNA polymerase omega subunit
LSTPTIDVLLKKINNRFLLANAVATRAKEISEGSLPYIEDSNPLNPIETAMNELARNKVEIKILEEPPKKEIRLPEARDFWNVNGGLEKEDKRKARKSVDLSKDAKKKSKSPKKK